MRLRLALGLSSLAFVACGSAANNATQPRDGSRDVTAGRATDGGHEAAAVEGGPPADANHDGPTTTDALQGGWYASLPAPDGGLPSTYRRRFVDGTYYETTVTPGLLCAETGTFLLDAEGVHFSPARAVGQTGCQLSTARVEPIAWAAVGIAFRPAGAATVYSPIQIVPKLFPAPETHDGDLAGDTSLAGATPIAKADALCNGSLGKPDGQAYKALLVDGVNRSATPSVDWVLRPNTTYFRPDGTLNVFRTDTNGLTNPDVNNLIEPNGDFWPWTGLYPGDFMVDSNTCRGWSSALSADLGRVGGTNYAGFAFGSSVDYPCDAANPIWCVSQ